MSIANKRLKPLLVSIASCLISANVFAAGEVLSVGTSTVPATPFRYTAEGMTHTWGAGENQLIESFTTESNTYRFASVANRVELARDDIAGVSTGVPCGVFAERAGANASMLASDFPNDAAGTGNCDIAAMLASRVVNRGALDLFSNFGPTPKNVERVDYIFDSGVIAPLSQDAIGQAGHIVAEKRGNNRVQIAAILSLDAFGQPMEFGPLVTVHESFLADSTQIRYGRTNLRHNYSFFQSNSLTPQAFPVFLTDSTETVGMAFVSAANLGLAVGQVYHGFSYFGNDVDSSVHTLTDVSTFPDNTADNDILLGDGADIYGGVSGLFVSDAISVATGVVFLDDDEDGVQDDNEAGISDISIILVEDVNANGVVDEGDIELANINSGPGGEIILPGLPNGQFILVIDNNDPDFPGGTEVPADETTVVFVINNDDPQGLNFGVTDAPVNDGGAAGSGQGNNADDNSADGSGNGQDNGAGDGAGDGQDGGAGDGTGDGQDGGAGDGAGDDQDGSVDGDAGDSQNGEGADGADSVGGPDNPNDGGPTDATGSEDTGNDGGNVPGLVTNAVADTAEVNQGDSVTIDVLANDIDGSGAGLTISSVEGSGNGTVMIVGGMLVYTPDFGFFDTDNFVYTVVDGNGTEASGPVSVEVMRFSDINNNGINDFVECNCSSLQLETGIHGSGLGGGLVHWSLLVLLAVAGFIRTRARSVRQRIFWSA